MRNVTRDQLGNPADVLEQNQNRERIRTQQQDWRQAVRDQQNPPPKVDRYSEMYDRLILQKGKSNGATSHLCAKAAGSLGDMAAVGFQWQARPRGVVV